MSSTSGFAQIIVVGALATIAALLATAVPATTANTRMAAAVERLAEIDIAAGSAFRRVIAALASPEDTLEGEALANEVSVTHGTVRIETEAGKLDVMLADIALFDRLAQNLGHPARNAFLDTLTTAQAAGNVRQALELVRTELAALVDDFDRVVTRYGGTQVDVLSALPEVLATLPDLTTAQVAQILAVPPAERAQFAGLSRYLTAGGRRFAIVARMAWAADEVAVRRLPIEVSTSGRPIVLGGPY